MFKKTSEMVPRDVPKIQDLCFCLIFLLKRFLVLCRVFVDSLTTELVHPVPAQVRGICQFGKRIATMANPEQLSTCQVWVGEEIKFLSEHQK